MSLNPRKPQAKIDVAPGAPGYIGCSVLASVIGLSDYSTPLSTYNAFMGHPDPITPEQAEVFRRGHMAEVFIANEIPAEYGYKLQKVNQAYVHPIYNWWICHPDRLKVGKVDGKRIGVEIKSSSVFVNSRWGKEDTDDIPIDYFFQCLGYMACGVCDEVHLFRCSNWKLTRYIISYDEERIRTMEKSIAREVTSWLAGSKPEPSTLEEAYEVWANPEDDMVADDAALKLCQLYDSLKAEEKALDERLDKAKVELINLMAGKSRLVTMSGKKLHTYAKQSRTTLDGKKLKEDMPEIFEKYSKTTDYLVFK